MLLRYFRCSGWLISGFIVILWLFRWKVYCMGVLFFRCVFILFSVLWVIFFISVWSLIWIGCLGLVCWNVRSSVVGLCSWCVFFWGGFVVFRWLLFVGRVFFVFGLVCGCLVICWFWWLVWGFGRFLEWCFWLFGWRMIWLVLVKRCIGYFIGLGLVVYIEVVVVFCLMVMLC